MALELVFLFKVPWDGEADGWITDTIETAKEKFKKVYEMRDVGWEEE